MSKDFFDTIHDWQMFEQTEPVDSTCLPVTNEPPRYVMVEVRPGETLADLAKRVYGTNNVINRLRIELANGGNIVGTIRIPR